MEQEQKAYIGGNLGTVPMDALDRLVAASGYPDRLTFLRNLLIHLDREMRINLEDKTRGISVHDFEWRKKGVG